MSDREREAYDAGRLAGFEEGLEAERGKWEPVLRLIETHDRFAAHGSCQPLGGAIRASLFAGEPCPACGHELSDDHHWWLIDADYYCSRVPGPTQ